MALKPLIVTELPFWFNPAADNKPISQNFIIPGAIYHYYCSISDTLTILTGFCARQLEGDIMEVLLLSTKITFIEFIAF
ncbi:MAG: hypothetical protein ACTS73_05615 [Arsenophonus sp. NEOnobi-MAG3]